MKSLSIISSLTLVSLAPGAALAKPGLHVHPHLAATRPLLDLPPTLSLAAALIVWAAVTIGVETFARWRRTAA